MTATVHQLPRAPETDKPRIRWNVTHRMWFCYGKNVYGAGLFPVRAYENWRVKLLDQLQGW